MIREPVVAGTFYSENPTVLKKQISTYLSNVRIKDKYGDIMGIISPHAGYVCSGQCAAFGFKALAQREFDLAVIIAPSHKVGGFKFSVGKYEAYKIPLGNVKVDLEEVEYFLTKSDFSFIHSAHSYEHSLEVQLPFLYTIKPEVKIVPIIFGNQSGENSEILANTLAERYKDKMEKTVFIASSDLSHYHDSIRAQEMDRKFADFVQKNQIDKLIEHINYRDVEACGFGGILTLLQLSKKLNYGKIENLEYTHSGNVTYDYSQVVGYLSTAIYR